MALTFTLRLNLIISSALLDKFQIYIHVAIWKFNWDQNLWSAANKTKNKNPNIFQDGRPLAFTASTLLYKCLQPKYRQPSSSTVNHPRLTHAQTIALKIVRREACFTSTFERKKVQLFNSLWFQTYLLISRLRPSSNDSGFIVLVICINSRWSCWLSPAEEALTLTVNFNGNYRCSFVVNHRPCVFSWTLLDKTI